MTEKILILDFGSQYTQLIARVVREANVYCEIIPFHKSFEYEPGLKGIILSGSPFSVNDVNSPDVNVQFMADRVPVLGVCYGAQLTAKRFGGRVEKSNKREYGRALLHKHKDDVLLHDVMERSQVWMSHADTILELPEGFELLATTESIPVAAFKKSLVRGRESGVKPDSYRDKNSKPGPGTLNSELRTLNSELRTPNSELTTPNFPLYGLQFHPEVYHSIEGKKILHNFLVNICGCSQDWTPAHFISDTVETLKKQIGDRKVIMALSGGVDSTVAATLIHKAIGDRLYGIFVDNGVLRKNEFENVLTTYAKLGLNVKGIDAKNIFYRELAGKTDPEAKRKVIGSLFIDIFQEEAKKIDGIGLLGQGTIYPDVIESMSVHGPSQTIKSHHNVGGLPEHLHLELVEPLRLLFKDEVRKVGRELGIPAGMIDRHPFPGPGLAIRILGEVNEEKVSLLQQADDLYIKALKDHQLYATVWQAGAILLPVKSVGVMGDERTYEFTVALRAVTSVDGMTADWAHLPYDFLADVSNEIINNVKGINRVVYDISSKPPATIEWE
ncbi:MAG TPA: glutamine-hydrolyzing GMP synthase [Chitinophagaceae bacterium]|nr:glutamine-hydrolyzing GMP synthase [Chitinophagaceae bacterium]